MPRKSPSAAAASPSPAPQRKVVKPAGTAKKLTVSPLFVVVHLHTLALMFFSVWLMVAPENIARSFGSKDPMNNSYKDTMWGSGSMGAAISTTLLWAYYNAEDKTFRGLFRIEAVRLIASTIYTLAIDLPRDDDAGDAKGDLISAGITTFFALGGLAVSQKLI